MAVGDRVTLSPTGVQSASRVQEFKAVSQRSKGEDPAGVQSASRVQEFKAASQRSKGEDPAGVQGASGGSEVAFITGIEDRKNYIIRKSSNLSKQSHIIAANVDQAFLIVTVNYPETSTTFIDRFLASAEAYSVPVVLVFNKLDLLNDDDRHIQQMLITLYENIGYTCVEVSAQTGEGIDRLYELLQGKITLLSGNSGVGKSTLINSLVPGVNLRTAEISDAHKTGMHTTTFSEMIKLPPHGQESLCDVQSTLCVQSPSDVQGSSDVQSSFSTKAAKPSANAVSQCSKGQCPIGGQAIGEDPQPPILGGNSWLIDTPGIKGFGTFDMEPEELTSYFREIFHFSKDCRFNNCTHTHEPGCAVLKALEEHYIAQSRYQSYLSMMEDKEDGKYRAAY